MNGVKDFARGSMRSYLIYKEKARRFNEDKEIQDLIKALQEVPQDGVPQVGAYRKETADALKGHVFDRKGLGARGLGYEKLDQLTVELILGVR
jgi:xylose isomerase